MKQFRMLAALVAFFMGSWANMAIASSHQEREVFARDFATAVLSIIQDQKKNFAERRTVLREAFSSSVDIDWIAKFVLGNSWNKASAEQKERYVTLYRKYLTESYVSNFAENPDKRIRDIKIDGVLAGDEEFTVRTQMMLASAENLRVSYLVHEKDGLYKVRDIAIENVSLITTHRGEFLSLARERGIDGVIAKLEEATGGKQLKLAMK